MVVNRFHIVVTHGNHESLKQNNSPKASIVIERVDHRVFLVCVKAFRLEKIFTKKVQFSYGLLIEAAS